jgi:hypothetical protein
VDGNNNVTRLPILINPKTEVGRMMQGTDSYMQNMIPENGGGRIWSTGTVGLAPQETVNGSVTNFTFLNGFTRQIPRRVQIDGSMWNGTNANGSVNWRWDATNTRIQITPAPVKDVRAFF